MCCLRALVGGGVWSGETQEMYVGSRGLKVARYVPVDLDCVAVAPLSWCIGFVGFVAFWEDCVVFFIHNIKVYPWSLGVIC